MQSIELIFCEFLSLLSIKKILKIISLKRSFEYFILLYSPNPLKKQANSWLNIQNYFPLP